MVCRLPPRAAYRYARVMSIRRITISVPSHLAAKVKRAAGKTPVSAYVAAVLEEKLDEEEVVRAWRAHVESVAPTSEDEARAERVIAGLKKKRRRAA